MKFYELYEGENYIYCLSELLTGGTLVDKIKKVGRFSEHQSLTLAKQLLEVLAYLESQNIIHRDLKLENILFKNKFFSSGVALVDFGFATKQSEYNKLFSRCGTPGFVAPEIYLDQPYTCNADVFSLGVVFFVMLTGKMPFMGDYNRVVALNLAVKVDFDLRKRGLKVADASNKELLSDRSSEVDDG